jgi:hypothetical protein
MIWVYVALGLIGAPCIAFTLICMSRAALERARLQRKINRMLDQC